MSSDCVDDVRPCVGTCGSNAVNIAAFPSHNLLKQKTYTQPIYSYIFFNTKTFVYLFFLWCYLVGYNIDKQSYICTITCVGY